MALHIDHDGIEITYLENDNQWEFTLRGRTRRVDSLAKAKEAIDKVPTEKNTFKRFDAWLINDWGHGQRELVTVTSFAGIEHYGHVREWWVLHKGKRTKVKETHLVAMSDSNDLIYKQIVAAEAEASRQNNIARELRAKLVRITPPADVDTATD